MTVPVVVGAAPRDGDAVSTTAGGQRSASGYDALGLSVKDLDPAMRQQLGLKSGTGIVISAVKGAAAEAGLQQGDLILMVNQQRVTSAAAFQSAAKALRPGDTVLLLVRRDDQTQFIGLSVPAGK